MDQFDSIVSSNLKRANATAGIALGLGIEPSEMIIRREPKFNELGFGPFEGLDWSRLDFEEKNFIFYLYFTRN